MNDDGAGKVKIERDMEDNDLNEPSGGGIKLSRARAGGK